MNEILKAVDSHRENTHLHSAAPIHYDALLHVSVLTRDLMDTIAASLGRSLVYAQKIGGRPHCCGMIAGEFTAVLSESQLQDEKPVCAQHDETPILPNLARTTNLCSRGNLLPSRWTAFRGHA